MASLQGLLGGSLLPEQTRQGSHRDNMLGSIASTGAGMRRGLGQAAGMDARTDGERAKEELGKLDPSNPADQEKIIALVSPLDFEKAMEMQAKFSKDNAEIEAKDKLGGAMLKMARDQGNKQIEEWLLAGGDVKTAASTLLKKTAPQAVATMYLDGKSVRTAIINGVLHYASESGWTEVKDKDKLTAQAPKEAKEKVTKAASLTKADRELYNSYFEDDESLRSAYTKEGKSWYNWDEVSENKKLQVMTRAKAIYTNNPELGQSGALKQAVAEAGGTPPPAKTVAQEKSSDSFSSLKP
tara:strand:+ start:3145 stop:4035 length:891 start_codon:yes stop_codon:yes gene_type:complete